MIAAIIFDMDGVLIDSEPLLLVATNRVLAPRGFELSAEENEVYLGFNQKSYWTDLKRRFALTDSIPDLMAERDDHVASLMRASLVAAPGVEALLHELKELNLSLALATSSGRDLVDCVFEKTGLRPCFDALATGDEVAEPKPDPEIFLLAASRLGVSPERCLVLEDSRNGVLAAQAAGMAVVRVVTETTRGLAFPTVDGTIEGFSGLEASELLSFAKRSAS